MAQPTAYQRVGAGRYDVTETGVPSIPALYYDGNDYLTTGVQEITATADFFAAAGHAWAVGGAFSTFTDSPTLFAKASATGANRTLQVFIFGGTLRVTIRGTTTDSGVTVTDGAWHTWLLSWDGTTCLLLVDGNAAATISVGAAAEEAEVILISGRTASSPAGLFTGFNPIDLLLSRAPSAAEAAQFMAAQNSYYRGV